MKRDPARLGLAAVFALLALGLSACASPPDLATPAPLRDAPSLGLSADAAAAGMPGAQWWREFGDEQLNTLVEQALASNPSLQIAQARLARAQAGVGLTQAANAPQLTAGIDATRQKFTAKGMIPPPLAGSVNETGTAQLTGSWELDFFGKNRAALAAALGNERAAQADAAAARTLLASTVARSYFQLARLHDLLAVAQAQLAQRTQVLRLVQNRVNAGLDTRLELRQSEATLPDARLQIEILQEQRALLSNALAALTGEPNRPLALYPPAHSAIKNISIPETVPVDLLGRRADIAAARWRVEAASQDTASARSQFYPNVNLVAFAGFSSIGLDRLLGAGSEQWGVGPALRLPLFDGGRLRANLRAKAAELEAAIASYNATVIEAVREVADQLTSIQAVTRQQAEQRAAQDSAEQAYAIATRRYEAGLGNLLQVLAAETAVLGQRRQGVDLTARALDTQVALMRALGGGYLGELPGATAHH
ncbi:efflux transporter outer membrane subunit [Rhodoferax sp.]|uniref:efflux transporter outer membrane subunit n=1 Tax=Rhodoferax sp. TaxID=50421 RepID=UPI00374DE0D4